MESLLGISLRFLSLAIWTFLIVAVVSAPVFAAAWTVDAGRIGSIPVVSLCSVISAFLCVYIPTAVTWFLCQNMHEWGSLNSLISKSWTRTPIWRAALSIKSGSRLLFSLLLFFCASILGALHVRFVSAMMRGDSLQVGIPVWALMPFGAVHALALVIQGKYRVQYPAVHMPRLQQLLDVASPAIKDGVHIWGRAAVLSSLLTILVFKPSITFSQVLVAAITSLCFTIAMSWSAQLVTILSAERLHRRGLQHVEHGVVWRCYMATSLAMYSCSRTGD